MGVDERGTMCRSAHDWNVVDVRDARDAGVVLCEDRAHRVELSLQIRDVALETVDLGRGIVELLHDGGLTARRGARGTGEQHTNGEHGGKGVANETHGSLRSVTRERSMRRKRLPCRKMMMAEGTVEVFMLICADWPLVPLSSWSR